MPEMPWSHLLLNFLRQVLAVLTVLKARCREALVLAGMNTHRETLEAQQITYHLATVIPLLLWITITLHPPRKLPCRLAGPIKPPTRPAMKKLRMGGVL